MSGVKGIINDHSVIIQTSEFLSSIEHEEHIVRNVFFVYTVEVNGHKNCLVTSIVKKILMKENYVYDHRLLKKNVTDGFIMGT